MADPSSNVEPDDTPFCSQCVSTVDAEALTCPYCQATRKHVDMVRWTSYRQGRRQDIVIAAVLIWLLATAVTVTMWVLIEAFTSSPR